MELLNFIREQFQVSTFELVVTVLGIVVLFLVGQGFAAIRKTEWYVQYGKSVDLLGNFILDQIVTLEAHGHNIDLTVYEERAAQRQEVGLDYIDPRMLYLLDKADDYVSARSGFNVSFDELLAKSEHIFQLYKNGDLK